MDMDRTADAYETDESEARWARLDWAYLVKTRRYRPRL